MGWIHFPFDSNNLYNFEVNTFSNNRDILKCHNLATKHKQWRMGYDNISEFSQGFFFVHELFNPFPNNQF